MTRMEAARRRLTIARYAIGVSAVSLFAVLGFVARAEPPGAASTPQVVTSDSTSSFFQDDSTPSYVGPAGSATPSIQSGGS